MQLALNYTPRHYFAELHSRSKRFTFVLAHRRAGKSYALAADMINRALRTKKQNAQFAYCAPTYTQAKTIIWKAFKTILGAELLARCKVNNSGMSITLPNGSEIRVFGLQNPDSLRGFFMDGIVIDEAQDISAELINTVILPSLADRKGWMVVSGTPKGTGNSFYRLYCKAKETPDKWMLIELPASVTKILSDAELQVQREELAEEEYAQEYELSFTSGNVGSIFDKYVIQAEQTNRIVDFEHNRSTETITVWDLGRDMCSVWLYQYVNGQVRIVDHKYWVGSTAEDCIYELKRHAADNGYVLKTAWLPHDAYDRSFLNGKTIQEVFWSNGFDTYRVPDVSLSSGIDAARMLLKADTTFIHQVKCAYGVTALKSYQYRKDKVTQMYSKTPMHNWASHPSDSFRYLALSIDAQKLEQSKLPSSAIIHAIGTPTKHTHHSREELAWMTYSGSSREEASWF